MAVWRLLDELDVLRSAAGQMAADDVLLDEIATGSAPALRLYRWRPPALSLGRFQPETDVDRAACERLGVEVVRRPTGGRALLHGGDLTYAVVLPRRPGRSGSVEATYRHLAGALTTGLARLGVRASIARSEGPTGPACFASQQGSDLRVGERKLCGSAQVHRGGALLQHGAILLRRLDFDETELLRCPHLGHTTKTSLRAGTVTLSELGAPCDARTVADAIASGFAEHFDVELRGRQVALSR